MLRKAELTGKPQVLDGGQGKELRVKGEK